MKSPQTATSGPRLDPERGVVVSRPAEGGPDPDTLEWVLPDGRGGFAHGTVSGVPTRRYHGLLTTPLGPEAKRHLLVGHVEERVTVDGTTWCLAPVPAAEGAPELPAATLVEFSLYPWPTWVFEAGGAVLVRDLQVCAGRRQPRADFEAAAGLDGLHRIPSEHQRTEWAAGGDRVRWNLLVRWSVVQSPGALELGLAPFLPFREADALTFANDVLDPGTRAEAPAGGRTLVRSFRPYAALPRLWLALDPQGSATWVEEPRWLRGIPLPLELARGYDGHEDRFSPGSFRTHLAQGDSARLDATLDPPDAASGREAWEEAASSRAASWDFLREHVAPSEALHRFAALAFSNVPHAEDRAESEPELAAVGTRPTRRVPPHGPRASSLGIVAGYPWFGEWGRDAFLAFPGLSFSGGLGPASAQKLHGVASFLRDGLLPNIYGTTPESSHYGSVDASLWFARAVRLVRRALERAPRRRGAQPANPRIRAELELTHALRGSLAAIRRAYETGTALGIQGEPGGLVLAGGPDLNPTWMDAQTSRGPVTPRAGCPVEIAALWILLLTELQETAEDDDERLELGTALERARGTFRARFWLEDEGTLADVWRPDGLDASVRPNMVLAAALDTTPLSRDEGERLLQRVDAELLTDRGLRTLSPRDPAYRPRYEGGTDERDGAYHQGTVWPWLLGSYVELCLRVRGEADRARLTALLDGVDEELLRAGLGHVSEVFDGDPPRRPGGTMAQAWNTGELLRARRMLEGIEGGVPW